MSTVAEPGQSVTLTPAIVSDSALLSNLLELYIHDMSDFFPNLELGPDGRFGYSRLPLYWSDAHRRFAFVIRYGGRPAGFALATIGSPASTDPDVLDVAEFFVIRQHRRFGVGRAAAFLLWNLLPGKWIVRVAEKNAGAIAFWRDVITDYSRGTATESDFPNRPQAWRVFSFENSARAR